MLTAVTGATGFLGLRLVRELLQRGEQLLLLARAHRVPVHVRIERFLIASKAGQDELRAARTRIETVDIELEAPLLGLDRDCFQKLADRIDTLWHCAGNISLSAPLEEVRLTNVEGTRHVLQLLSAGERDPVLSHISTVAVAGAQPGGVVEEKILHGRFGFNTFYEQSKFEAEALVHLWVERHAGRALIFRPSGLVTQSPAYSGRPPHLLQMFAQTLAGCAFLSPDAATDGILALPVAEGAQINLLPVEHAVYAMAEVLLRRDTAKRPQIYHVVNHLDLPVSEAIAAIAHHLAVPLVTVPLSTPSSPGVHAALQLLPMYANWAHHSRTYEDRNLRDLGLAYPGRPVVNRTYLASALQ